MDLERNSIAMGKRPALVLVDMINGFTQAACPLGTDCPDVVEANRQLLEAFRAKGFPVFFTSVVYYNDSQATVFRARINDLNVLTPDSDWVKVDDRLVPLDNEAIVEKRWPSGFFQTDLAQQLLAEKADCLVVTGLTTSGCVRATVLDGMQHEYPVFVPREAVGDRNPQAHTANLFDMHAKYADVVSVEEILNQI